MSMLKKTLVTGLAAAAMAASATSFTATSAQAGYHYSGGYHYPVCRWVWVWRTNYYGKRYRVRVRTCH